MDFMSILVKRILKSFLQIYDGFCVMVDFPYELFLLVKRFVGLMHNCNIRIRSAFAVPLAGYSAEMHMYIASA